MKIGIRREDKNRWERRVALTPTNAELLLKEGHEILIQPSPIRIFSDDSYKKIGATLSEDLSSCDLVIGVKEMPQEIFREEGVYLFFSHTIKGQAYNMNMLQTLLDKKCTLMDYEKIVDDKGRRKVFFGPFAGQAGMIDSLWALGRRFQEGGLATPFLNIKQALNYTNLAHALNEIKEVGEQIKKEGLDKKVSPLTIAVLGNGNVAKGAMEILSALPVEKVNPEQLVSMLADGNSNNKKVYLTVFEEKDLVRSKNGSMFNLQEYYEHPERYEADFAKYVNFFSIIMNCIYWTEKYPIFVSESRISQIFQKRTPKLKVIGDVTCDIKGSVEVNLKSTDSGDPVYVYDVDKKEACMGVKGNGPVVLAVDNLPCELAEDSSTFFSNALKPYSHRLATTDFSVSFDDLNLKPELKGSIIAHQGELTPDYHYLKKFL